MGKKIGRAKKGIIIALCSFLSFSRQEPSQSHRHLLHPGDHGLRPDQHRVLHDALSARGVGVGSGGCGKIRKP